MTQALLQKRMHLMALAALLAMVAALFAAFPSASAAAVGDVSATSGTCEASGDDYVTDVTVKGPDNTNSPDDADEDLDDVPVACTEAQVGPVSVTPNGTINPIVQAVAPSVSITLNDSDGVVSHGSLTATVSLKNFTTNGSDPAVLNWIRVSGVLDGVEQEEDKGIPLTDNAASHSIIIPEGTSEGEYIVSALVTQNHDKDSATDDKTYRASTTFTVGDPGTDLASATIALGTETYDVATTTADETKAEDGVEAASAGDIWLEVKAMNSLGNASNSVSSIIVLGARGTIAIHAPDAAGQPAATALASGGDSANHGADLKSTTFLKVTKTDGKPGTVSVYAIVTGADGAATTETVDLTFTGSAEALELGEAANTSAPGSTEFTVDATDSGGNAAGVGVLSFSVTNADGDAVGQDKVKVSKSTAGASTPDDDSDDNPNATAGLVEIGKGADPGEYTIEVSLVGVDDSEATTSVTVVGNPADVAVSADMTSSDTIGDVITVTASVTDADGNAVADGTAVTFSASTGTGLAAIGTGHTDGSETKDGSASVKYAVVGAGSSVVSATAGSTSNVVVITSTAGEAAAEEEAPAEVHDSSGLSSTTLNSFTSWTADNDSTASQVFSSLAARGAQSLQLWNGTAWLRYSMVDGAMVPGSIDFTIMNGDVLYIGG